MTRSLRDFSLGVLLASVLAGLAQAQTPQAAAPDSAATIHQRQRAALEGHLPSDFGPNCCAILQIPAAAFQAIGGWGSWSNTGYVYATGGTVAIAPVELPTGTVIVYVDLYYDDTDASSDINVNLDFYPGYGNTAPVTIKNVMSVGSGGQGYKASDPFTHTVNNNPSSGGGQYSLVATLVPISGSLGLKGVDLWYYRQVSPAPGTATFQDVPTNHQYFQFIEALSAAGITAGCNVSPPQYCPDRQITRGEMAVYLAKALGLEWPY